MLNDDPVTSVVSIAPFSPTPRLEFKDISIGCTAVQRLIVQNPTDCDRELYIRSYIPSHLDVALDWHECTVEKHSNMLLTISWMPTDEIETKSLLIIYDGGMMHRNIVIYFSSVWDEDSFIPDADLMKEDDKELSVIREVLKMQEELEKGPSSSNCTQVSNGQFSSWE